MKMSLRLTRSVMAGAAVASLALVASNAGATSRPAAVHAHTTGCTGSSTVNWINTNGNGAAGSIYYELQFTNLSGHSCTFTGYPGVSAVNLAGNQWGPAAAHVAATAHVITLLNNASAQALLKVTNVGVFSTVQCGAVMAAGLRVYAPNSLIGKIVPFPVWVCSKNLGVLSVSPLTH